MCSDVKKQDPARRDWRCADVEIEPPRFSATEFLSSIDDVVVTHNGFRGFGFTLDTSKGDLMVVQPMGHQYHTYYQPIDVDPTAAIQTYLPHFVSVNAEVGQMAMAEVHNDDIDRLLRWR